MTRKTVGPHPRRLGLFPVLLASALFLPGAALSGDFGASPASSAISMEEAANLEKTAYSTLYFGFPSWSVENTRELSRTVDQLPTPVASRVLWLSVTAMSSFDSTQIIIAALSSRSATIRIQGADILTGLHSPDTLRMLLTRLFQSERDASVLLHAIDGMATKPFPESVRNLMEVMETSKAAQSPIVEAAAVHLRRLTRANIPSSAIDWRDWWMSHSRDYQ
ncbi:MAG: hypothetical protein LBV15_00110 [Planctomycetota bacterium]|nr:hypothetical protein [Planctomycetota bacterium]